MDEKIENPELKAIMAIDPEEMNEEELESFVEHFINAKLIIPAEVDTEKDLDELNDEDIALDEEIDITILKLEDEESGEVYIPAFTDDEEIEKLGFEKIYGLVFETEDLANLLYETFDEDIEGIILNPNTDFTAEIPLDSLFELFDLEECDDPNCCNPNHHHHHEH